MLDDIDLIIADDFNQKISNFKSKAQLYKLNMTRFIKTRRPTNAKETDMIISTLHLNKIACIWGCSLTCTIESNYICTDGKTSNFMSGRWTFLPET